jgi:excisionase family DNA binding protein
MPSSHNDDPVLMPIGEVSSVLGVSVGTLRRWDKEGHLVAVRAPGGRRMFRRTDVDELIQASA